MDLDKNYLDKNLMPGAHVNSEQNLFRRLFPPRQVFFRAHGDISYFTISTAIQVTIVSFLLVFSIWVIYASANVIFRDEILASKDQAIAELEASNQVKENDIAELQGSILEKTEQLEARQGYLQTLMANDPTGVIPKEELDAIPQAPEPVAGHEQEGATTKESRNSVGSFLIGAAQASPAPAMTMEEFESYIGARLSRIEEEQEDLARELEGLAEERLAAFNDMLAPFKMTAVDLANATDFEFMGQGGPYVPENQGEFSDLNEADYSLDIPFPELSEKWAEMLKVYEGVKSIPLATPAENFYVSSRFGRRTDPLTKERARHYGLDLAGWPGEKIFTTGDGVVVKAGTWGAYGQMVEIDHGNGFTTRYGHMKKVLVTRGQNVKAGDIIGLMGCSGRCTSTHLHYEVMFNGTNRNPQPFMEAPEDVQQTQRQANSNPDERG